MANTDRNFHDALCDLHDIASKIELREGDSGTEIDARLHAIEAALRAGAEMKDELKNIRRSVRRTVGLDD